MHEFGRDYFDALYETDVDPWRFRTSTYERDKYAATLAALPRAHYGHLLELGCSIGELTRQLAPRAKTMTVVDVSPVALAEAQRTCASLAHVRFVEAQLPGGAWEGAFDGVVLSEILYYLEAPQLVALARRLGDSASGADMVLVHWTGETNYPLAGDTATEIFCEELRSHRIAFQLRTGKYRLDVLQPT